MKTNPKFAVILSGSGVYDGSEIHEAVLSLLAIERCGASFQCFAPNVDQMHVINHLTGEEMTEKRNVLVESARIARGQIQDLEQLVPEDFDALFLPGGYGAAKNLSSFAVKGKDMEVEPTVKAAVNGFARLRKPIGSLCISPVVLASVLGKGQLTIGNDPFTSDVLRHKGAVPVEKGVGEICVDHENRLVTSPCYMLNARISDIFRDSEQVVREVIRLI